MDPDNLKYLQSNQKHLVVCLYKLVQVKLSDDGSIYNLSIVKIHVLSNNQMFCWCLTDLNKYEKNFEL